MILKKANESSPTQRDLRALLEQGCDLDGQLRFTGVVRLNGRLKGDIESTDFLIVGSTAEIQGDINIGEIIIGGHIQGNVRARHRVEILATGCVIGSVESPALVTHEGAQIVGEVRVRGSSVAPTP